MALGARQMLHQAAAQTHIQHLHPRQIASSGRSRPSASSMRSASDGVRVAIGAVFPAAVSSVPRRIDVAASGE